MTKLNDYLKTNKIRDQAFADMVKSSRSMITKLRHGTATPSLQLALRISEATKIDVRDLMPTESEDAA